jgi:hypothetical protein
MFCSQCGSKLDGNSKFCYSCGSPVSGQEKLQSSSQKAVVTFGSEPDERWDPETDIALWVANVSTGNSKSAEEWGAVILAIYRRLLEGSPRWESFTELFNSDQAQLFQLLILEDLQALELSDLLTLTLQEASHVVDDPKSRLRNLEPWLDCRDWEKVSGVTQRDRGRIEFVRAFIYAINNLASDEFFLEPLAESLKLGFGPAALPIAEESMFSRSDLGNAVTTLIQGKDGGSAACAEWLEELEVAPGEYSGTVSDEDGNEVIAFVSFNAGGFGRMPER